MSKEVTKHVIEIPDDIPLNPQFLVVYGTEPIGNKIRTYTIDMDETEELDSDYIKEHFPDLLVQASYQRGYKAGHEEGKKVSYTISYQRGLDDAWEAARKVALNSNDGGLGIEELDEIFGCYALQQVFRQYSAQQTIEKIKAYEEKQKADDEIKVGDEVEVLNSGSKYLIAWISGTILCGFAHDGVTCRLQPSDVRKTGRHFDIAKILEEMKA